MEHHFTKSQKLLAFFFLFGIFFVVVAILASVNRIQNRQAFTYTPRAEETALAPGYDDSGGKLSYTPIRIDQAGIDLSTVERRTTDSGCNYATFMGYARLVGKIMCRDENRPGSPACSYSGIILCLDSGDAHPITVDYCAVQDQWSWMAKNICCDEDFNFWFQPGRKEYCDAVCKTSCVPEKNGEGKWGWTCPRVRREESPTQGGGGQTLPIEPISNTQ